jgi:hypothetical protein
MIEAHELTKRYGDKTAVHTLSFTIAPGTVTGFHRAPLALRRHHHRRRDWEWGYYVFGSAIEVVLLALVIVHSARWQRAPVTAHS